MATVTVTGISSNTTFTCSYGNVSDTCTVTVPAYSLAFSQDTYTIETMGDVTISCTLKNGNTPMSGETVTLTWNAMGASFSENVTTGSNGVASYTFDYFDGGPYPVTLTATSHGASATCTINESGGGGPIIID